MMKQKDTFLGPTLAMVLTVAGVVIADDEKKPAANSVNSVKGVKQEAVPSVRKVEPPTIDPAAMTVPEGVNQVDGVNNIEGVKATGQEAPAPRPPAPAGSAAQGVNEVDGVDSIKGVKAPAQKAPASEPPAPAAKGVNQVEGVKAMPPNAVQPVLPPPAGAVSTIQAVKGVQGIIAPKQLNLEAALQVQQGGTPAGPDNGKGAAAAAALLSAPPGLLPGPPEPGGDGRDAFQQFEELKTPGS